MNSTAKNTSPSRIGSLCRKVFTRLRMSDATDYIPLFIDGGEGMGSYTLPLSLLSDYRAPAKDPEPAELRDVEANLLRGLADDVTVCARPSSAELTVVKKLPDRR